MKIKRTLTTGIASIGLVVGLSGFAGATSGSNTDTGPDSWNKVRNKTTSRVDVDNNNNVSASNSNSQSASTGTADAEYNTTAGDAMSGHAENANSLSASLAVDNSEAGVAAMSMPPATDLEGSNTNTGFDSYNYVENTVYTNVDVTNNNNLSVTNTNSQNATSGNASVSYNTTGGSAMSGDASNTNATTINFAVTN